MLPQARLEDSKSRREDKESKGGSWQKGREEDLQLSLQVRLWHLHFWSESSPHIGDSLWKVWAWTFLKGVGLRAHAPKACTCFTGNEEYTRRKKSYEITVISCWRVRTHSWTIVSLRQEVQHHCWRIANGIAEGLLMPGQFCVECNHSWFERYEIL